MDVWKIGIEIGAINGAGPVLTSLASQLLGINTQANQVGQSFAAWSGILQGAAAILGGAALLGGINNLIDKAKELVHVQEQFKMSGASSADLTAATSASWATAQKYGLNVQDVLGDIKEMQMPFGSTREAIDFIDYLESQKVIMNAVSGGSGAKLKDAVYDMTKAGELKGLMAPEQYQAYFGGMTKAVVASGGKVTPADFLLATRYGRIASKGWDEEFYTTVLPSLIQEQGANSAGTALSSLYGTLVQGKVSKRSLQMLSDIGLIGDKSLITYNKLGDPVGMKPGAIVGTDQLTKDPFKWAQEVLNPLLHKKFGNFEPGDPRILDWIGGAFGARLSAQDAAVLTMEGSRLNKDKAMINRASNDPAQIMANDPNFASANLSAAVNNLKVAFGMGMVGPVVAGMNAISGAMNAMTGFAVNNPGAAKAMTELTAGIGAAAVAWGSYKVGTGIWSAMTGGGLMGSATALSAAAAQLSAAAVALGGSSVGGAAGAAAGAAAGWGGKLMRGGLWAAAALFGKQALDGADPGGDLWGLTGGIDHWMQSKFGFNFGGNAKLPALVEGEQARAAKAAASDLRSMAGKYPQYALPTDATHGWTPPQSGGIAPTVVVNPPAPATMTGTVILNGAIIGQLMAALVKAAGGLGMPSSPALPNSRATVPTPDGGGHAGI